MVDEIYLYYSSDLCFVYTYKLVYSAMRVCVIHRCETEFNIITSINKEIPNYAFERTKILKKNDVL